MASLAQLLQVHPQRPPHGRMKRSPCPTVSPEQQHQPLQLLGHAEAGAAAAGSLGASGGSIGTLPRACARPGGPGSHRGSWAPAWAPGPAPELLARPPSPGLPALPCPVANDPADSHRGQQQGKCSQQDADVAHGSDTCHRHCTGGCGAGPPYIGMAR